MRQLFFILGLIVGLRSARRESRDLVNRLREAGL
jgi:hypothetical protein